MYLHEDKKDILTHSIEKERTGCSIGAVIPYTKRQTINYFYFGVVSIGKKKKKYGEQDETWSAHLAKSGFLSISWGCTGATLLILHWLPKRTLKVYCHPQQGMPCSSAILLKGHTHLLRVHPLRLLLG